MDLNCFFEALEELANRLFDFEDPFDNLQKIIQIIKVHVSHGLANGNYQSQLTSGTNSGTTSMVTSANNLSDKQNGFEKKANSNIMITRNIAVG